MIPGRHAPVWFWFSIPVSVPVLFQFHSVPVSILALILIPVPISVSASILVSVPIPIPVQFPVSVSVSNPILLQDGRYFHLFLPPHFARFVLRRREIIPDNIYSVRISPVLFHRPVGDSVENLLLADHIEHQNRNQRQQVRRKCQVIVRSKL